MPPMIPWIEHRLVSSEAPEDAYRFGGSHPVYALVILLQEVEQRPKKNLLVMDPPRSVVFTGSESGLYLFREGSRVPIVSFALNGNCLASVNYRYNDPMDPNSGRRPFCLLSGWQGTAELLSSAVRHSKYWKHLETIEVGNWYDRHLDARRVEYKVWATPSTTMTFGWQASEPKATVRHLKRYPAGQVTLVRNKPVLLARVEVAAGRFGDDAYERVVSMQPYPELAGWHLPDNFDDIPWRGTYCNDYWWEPLQDDKNTESALRAPVFVDLSDTRLIRIHPHDDFEINWQ